MPPVWRKEGHATGRRNATSPSESVATRNTKLIDGSVRRMGCEFVECLTGYSLETEFLTEIEFHRNRFPTHCFSYVYVYENKWSINGIFVRNLTETRPKPKPNVDYYLVSFFFFFLLLLLNVY